MAKALIPWTEQVEEIAKLLLADGHTLSAVAARIGTTKNAVVGRAYRQGWFGPKPKRKKAIRQAPTQLEKYENPISIPIPPTGQTTILDVGPDQCRFPLTDQWPWTLCGEPAVWLAPYCREHCTVCYSGFR